MWDSLATPSPVGFDMSSSGSSRVSPWRLISPAEASGWGVKTLPSPARHAADNPCMTGGDRADRAPGPAVAYAIVFDEARRGLENQSGALDELRGRSGTLLAAASVAVSFLGGIALEDGSVTGWGVAAVVTFSLVVGAVFSILWPFSWRFVLSAEILITDWVEAVDPPSVNELRRELARVMERNQSHNQRQLNRLWKVYSGAILLLLAMIIFWLVELAEPSFAARSQ